MANSRPVGLSRRSRSDRSPPPISNLSLGATAAYRSSAARFLRGPLAAPGPDALASAPLGRRGPHRRTDSRTGRAGTLAPELSGPHDPAAPSAPFLLPRTPPAGPC